MPKLSPINDIVFKLLLGDPSRPELISAFLPILAPDLSPDKIRDLRFVDPQQRGDSPEDNPPETTPPARHPASIR